MKLKSNDSEFIKRLEYSTGNIEKYKTKNPLKFFIIKKFIENILTEVENKNPGKILDIGGGEGILAELIEKKLNKKVNILDIDKEDIFFAKKYFNKTVIYGNLYNLPFLSNSYDMVICLEVLEHIENLEKSLEEIKRISSKNIILSVPNSFLFRIGNIVSFKNLRRLGESPDHKNYFNIKKINSLISQYFTVEKIICSSVWIIIICKKNSE